MPNEHSSIWKVVAIAIVTAWNAAGCSAKSQAEGANDVTTSPQALTEARGKRPKPVLRFSTMYGVDGGFVGDAHPVRGLSGDSLPWQIAGAEGLLLSDGTITVAVRGLVFPNDPEVPPAQRGINDEDHFRALVSCLTETGDDTPVANVATQGFPATQTGNAFISERVSLPNPCVAPIVFIVSGGEDDWLAVTGVETE
jgi:hypothetical protein